MELIRDLEAIDPRYRGCVLSVGVFDGVHVGHQKVLGTAVERARDAGAQPVVFTFHPHPLEILRPAEAPPLIQTFGQKLELLRQIGIAAVVWPRDMEGVLALTPEEFFERIVAGSLAARAVVEGSDFRFGAGGKGDDAMLARLAAARGIAVESVEHITVDGERVSSTRIRRLITEGRVAEAARCLGRPYSYVGTVVEGHHRGGKLLGYPTVNIDAPRFLIPAQGVYAGWAAVGGRRLAAAVSVGSLPTFHRQHPIVVEAFLLDFEGELYGAQVALEFVERLRSQAAFATPDGLRQQLAADCDRVRTILAT
jgi:riboflavin kinase / FMN adenylyltransferase